MLDKLFINGEIYSMKKEGEKFQSLGVKDGKITFLGTRSKKCQFKRAYRFKRKNDDSWNG